MEAAAQRAQEHERIDVPDLHKVKGEQGGQNQRAHGDARVGQHHDAAAVAAVHERASQRADEDAGQQRHQGGGGQHGGRAGLLGEIPNQGELHQLAAQQREGGHVAELALQAGEEADGVASKLGQVAHNWKTCHAGRLLGLNGSDHGAPCYLVISCTYNTALWQFVGKRLIKVENRTNVAKITDNSTHGFSV